MISEEIEKLHRMKENGALSEEEFQRAKEKVLAGEQANRIRFTSSMPFGLGEKTYCMLLHLSQYAGFITLGLGLVVPVVLWVFGKDNSEEVDWHGKMIIDWLISVIIYAIISVLLTFVFIGFLLLAILGIMILVFPIIGAIKANEGERYQYPFSLKILNT